MKYLINIFLNWEKKFNSDLNGKVMNGIFKSELSDAKYNCNSQFKLKVKRCNYGGF